MKGLWRLWSKFPSIPCQYVKPGVHTGQMLILLVKLNKQLFHILFGFISIVGCLTFICLSLYKMKWSILISVLFSFNFFFYRELAWFASIVAYTYLMVYSEFNFTRMRLLCQSKFHKLFRKLKFLMTFVAISVIFSNNVLWYFPKLVKKKKQLLCFA